MGRYSLVDSEGEELLDQADEVQALKVLTKHPNPKRIRVSIEATRMNGREFLGAYDASAAIEGLRGVGNNLESDEDKTTSDDEIPEAQHTEGPFLIATSNSYRRIVNKRMEPVCIPTKNSIDGHPDMHFPNGGAHGPDANLLAASAEMSTEMEKIISIGETICGVLKTLGVSHYADELRERLQSAKEVLKKARSTERVERS